MILRPQLRSNVMSVASSTAISGMKGSTLRLDVSADNVANALSDGPLPSSADTARFPRQYVPLRVDQIDLVGGSISASVCAASPSYVPKFDPTAPYTDGNGMVASPNVDLASEIIQQFLARYTFAANALVVRTDAQMTAMLLNITT
jgi:flagellar basal-body rod protein FlgC